TPLELDRLIHERLRLGIISALAVNDCLSFNDLKRLLHTTDGNLSVHARKLEDAQYISCDKSFDGRVPRTEYRLAPAGRRAPEKYLGHREAIIRAIKPYRDSGFGSGSTFALRATADTLRTDRLANRSSFSVKATEGWDWGLGIREPHQAPSTRNPCKT